MLPLREWRISLLWLAVLLGMAVGQSENGGTYGFINFAQLQLVVNEGTGQTGFTSVQIPLVREGGVTGQVFAGITIQNANDGDFLATTYVASFEEGVTSSSVTAFIVDDALPEGNETFTVVIDDARNGAEVGLRNTMTLIILASDAPFGAVQFQADSLSVTAEEPLSTPTDLQLTVTRGPGTFGRVTVDYQVTSDPSGADDLASLMGQLVFEDQEASQLITLSLLPDNLPEPDEVFTVQLSNPRGGATLASDGTVSMVTIRENDSPLRWSVSVVEVVESVRTVELTVTRGLLEGGSIVGDLTQTTSVSVSTASGTASAGTDFEPISTIVNFAPGVTMETVTITILDDTIPEGDEMFMLMLSSPSTDAVLVPPSTIAVVIAVNDNAGGIVSFASPGPVIIREDSGEVGRFIVQRSIGTFGNLTVEWRITDNVNEQLAVNDFQPPSGTLFIPDGTNEATLEITAFDDDLPEVAEGFVVALVSVVSGNGVLTETGVRMASLIITESDNVYGLVEWGSPLSVAATAPRELRMVIQRSRGDIGIISIDYTITYVPVGASDSDPNAVALAMGSVQLQGGQSARDFSVTIPNNMFLEPGAAFRATITNTTLVGGATLLIPSVVSPSIGPLSTVDVSIPENAANGYIAFDPSSLQVSVEEPMTVSSRVSLTITRSGSYGLAVVMWLVTPQSADITDVGATTGSVSIPDGANSAQLEVDILPDDLPEVEELFVVTLVTTNQDSQRIQPDQNIAVVRILQNDAAEGVFSISPSTSGPFLVDESFDDTITIAIIREGGALTTETIFYNIAGGVIEIFGGQGFTTFAPGQRESSVNLLINDDNIPETNETYVFEISSSNADILGMPRAVVVTILANDDYAGLFLLDASSLDQTLVEPRDGETSVATFTVERSRGTFTDVMVTWEVVGGGADLQPTAGVVSFAEGQSTGSFEINILPDNMPEAAEVFTVRLVTASGAAALSPSDTQTSLTVAQNDDPISFTRSFVQAAEGEVAEFMVARGGQAIDTSEVTFSVIYTSASQEDVIITPTIGIVTFAPGQTEAVISVGVVDDVIPEENELLTLRLDSVTGDAVVVESNDEATLLITPSDDPNGVFQFEAPTVQAVEGDAVTLTVERLGGVFGEVSLSWTVYQLNGSARLSADVSDVSPTTNFITFDPGNLTAYINLNVVDDLLPELSEIFEIELTIFNVIGDSANSARIGDIGTLTLTVAASDDPYGLFSVDNSYVEVAEDVPSNNPSLGSLSLDILRGAGTVGQVTVVWEILSEALPSYTDLFLVGEGVSGVTDVTARPHIGTRALNFRGQPGDLLSVPSAEQPDLSDQLTISLWLKPSSGMSGVLVAQATGSTPIYRLSLIADSDNFIVRFSYTSGGSLLSVETSVSQSSLAEGAWHSLVLTTTNQIASFFSDGVFLTSRTLTGPTFSGRGQLTVGGVPGGISTSDFFSGDLQDVRIFSTALSQRQVTALTDDLAAQSITPISGYLTYPPAVTLATISAATIDDNTPEPSQEFIVQLANTVGGARINPFSSTAILNVLKSDSSNGVFGFDPSAVAVTTSEGTRLSLLITRTGGSFEGVYISWEARQNMELASLDFDPSSGRVKFSEGQLTGILNVTVIDELVPELLEIFTITLTSAVADDNQTSSTPSSGASIDTSFSQSVITVTENDSPYGLFQFVTSPPLPGVPIAPATEQPQLFVDESVGTVTVYVVRAQGRLGNSIVEYITSDGSALSDGGAPDFVPTAGSLDFIGEGVVQMVTVTVLDNQLPELQKTFYVNLTNPSGTDGTPDLGVGSTLAIHIQPSDDAFGRFNLDSNSRARVVAEQQGGTPVTLSVLREGGVFGDVSLYWRVSQSGGSEVMDITPSEGTLMFSEGSNVEDIQLTIRDDLNAELSEVFMVTLINVTVGASLGPFRVGVITIEASDHPYGLFTFAPPPSGVAEGQEVIITVIREFGTVGQVRVGVVSVESADTRLNSLQLDLETLEEEGRLAIPGLDYAPISSSLTFEPGQTTATLSLSILQDDLPELGELLFLTLTQATLNTTSVDAVDTSVLPQVAPGNESVAVEIAENDNARGVVELSEVTVTTAEPSEQILSIMRREGTFGEITVQWEVTPVTASQSDYTPMGGTVTFAPGQSTRPLPLAVVDDSLPEFDEMFTVRLVGVVGSAVLGDVIVSTVTIEANDDPNGALEFALTELEIAEPDSTPAIASFVVQRVGGAVGVVGVTWTVTRADGSAVSEDVLPVSGTLAFVSNSRQQTIRLSILPDTVPERTEVFIVRLGEVSGGARVEVSRSTATLTVPENDSPYGVLSFASETSVAVETGDVGSFVTMIPVIRSLGTFGDLRLTYSVQSANAATLALASGTPLLDFYTDPTPNTALSSQAQLQTLQGSLDDCATACLGNEACRSFSIASTNCELYFTSSSQGAAPLVAIGTDYYEKIQELVMPFYQAVASEGNDFTPVIGQTILVPDGIATTTIPVTLIGDALPELNESLVVTLLGVELVTESLEGVTSGEPSLGAITETSLIILENDDPRGRFAIYGSNGVAVTRVSESEAFDFGVSLTVERQGGTLGEVSVQWGVVDSTAVEGEDYTGTGAVLTFADGVSRATVALTILADDIPERDETIRVMLSNPMGGATVGTMGTSLIVIEANDGAAGVVGFDSLSRSAVIGEGEQGGVEIVRAVSALGIVRVAWQLTTDTGDDPTNEFGSTSGTATFQDGENTTLIIISVAADSQPEVEERFTLTLTSIETLSDDVAPSGHAILNPIATMATVTIRASNNPHGVVEFQSRSVRLLEGGAMGVAIVRQFGAIGIIDVGYTVMNGSLRTLALNESLAIPTADFVAEAGVVTLVDGQQSAVVPVRVVNDGEPELDEVFLVRLTSVTLVGGATSNLPPSLGAVNVSEVIIPANDSPQGEMTFEQATYEVSEEIGTFQLPILRVQGLVGQVSVVYFVTNGLAVINDDFESNQLEELVFAPGQTQRIVSIVIVNDELPEVAEEFCVQLQLPRAGAILGNITTTCITIVANDDAYGVFRFESSSLTSTIQETSGTAVDSNVAELIVTRGGGLFGQITVPFEVRAAGTGEQTTADLSPLMGSALVFNQEDSFRILRLEAIQDSIPELDETFTITLLPPIEFGRLASTNTMATVTIESNQDPYGVFQLSLVSGTTSVEEEVVLVDFELSRTFGTFGEVSVTMETIDGTALFSTGSSLVYSAIQTLSGGEVWHSLSVGGGRTLLVLGGESEVQLLAWRGVYTPVQTLPATRVSAITSFSPQEGVDLLLIANGGSPGNRELTVDVYQFTGSESIALVQTLPSLGVTDLGAFSAGGQWHVLVANGENNAGINFVDSTLWRWNGSGLEQKDTVSTIGASAVDVFSLSGSLYVVVGSLTDIRSQLYVWNGTLALQGHFDSNSVQDVLFLPPSSLAVASQTLELLVWSTDAQNFLPNSTLDSNQPIRLELFSEQLFVANANSSSQIFTFQNGVWTEDSVSLPVSRHLYPLTINSTFYLASAGSSRSVVMETLLIDSTVTDYFSRSVDFIFAPGETELRFSVRIVNDLIPEIDETFSVQLSNALGGARIGTNGAITMEILTNDDAHGLIGFAEGSLSVIVNEESIVVLEIARMGGAFGLVSVAWEISGSHADGEITPSQGTVTFVDGQSLATITLTIAGDVQPELSETTFVSLTQVLANGVPEGGDLSRGATIIPGREQAVVTVQASDAPHGVVSWLPAIVMVTEVEGVDSVAVLSLVREFGSIGAIVIEYSTSVASLFPSERQAAALVDFVPSSGEVVMGDGVREASVDVTILHDNLAELTESFFVNISSVRLVNEADRQGSESLSPRAGVEAVEVQILENDDSRGSLSFAMSTASVDEVVDGRVRLEVRRAGGTFGAVGVDFSALGVSASSLDFEPSSGSVTLESGVAVAFIEISIINDPEPEMDETFEVRLLSGAGGATIGEPSTVLVTILSNDDINGVFSFTDTSLLFLIPESTSPTDPMGVVTLTVQRTINFVGVVNIYWEVNEDGLMDLEPTSGNLTFAPPTASQSFTVRAVNDGLPEQFEAFSVSLFRTEGGGRIVDPREARIAIQSSNDPSGVVGFTAYPQGIIANEGAEIRVGVFRSSGTQGTVTLTWSMSPPDNTVFLITTDTVVFTDGQSEATFAIRTLSDTTPEVARLFSLDIVSASLASIDVNSTHIDLIVAASDDPHGVIQFSVGALSVVEGEASVPVTVVRGDGLVGDVRVNFDLQLSSADQNDFNISSQYLLLSSGQPQASLSLIVIDDPLPEAAETFTISITSVELQGNNGRDFEFSGDPSLIDQPPSIGATSQVTVTIEPSDDPFGSITLTSSSYSANEGGVATISLSRTGGTLGVATAAYTTSDGTATSPADYQQASGSVQFAAGETSTSVLISIVDDITPELEESFTFTLTGSTSAALGSITMATVIIAASDSPFGIVGFAEDVVSNGIQLPNPTIAAGPTSVTLTMSRVGGAVGSTEITWEVRRSSNGEFPRDDITPISAVLVLSDGQAMSSITLDVLPSDEDEVEETYIVTFVLASNNVLVNSDLSSVAITVAQMGNPQGIVSFVGDVLSDQRVNEGSTLSLPVTRTGSAELEISVSYIVTRLSGSGLVNEDASPSTGSVVMPLRISQVNLDLSIIADEVPELDESFRVTLTGTNAVGVGVDPQANTAPFTISFNDSPFGLFSLSSAVVTVDSTQPLVSRSLRYTIQRSLGNIGDVTVTISNTFTDTSVEYVTPIVTRVVPSGTTSVIVTLAIAQGSFLAPGSEFTSTITSAIMETPIEITGQPVDFVDTATVAVVGSDVSNTLISLEPGSLSAAVNDADGSVLLTVTRVGVLDTVDVQWSVGSLVGGALTPPTGVLTLLPTQTAAVISLTATPTIPHGLAEVFSVTLTAQSRSTSLPTQVDQNADTALIEPWGVLQLGGSEFSGVEGRMATISVWRRFGSVGEITITGVASMATSIPSNRIAATPGIDFPVTPQSVTMGDGQTISFINFSLPNNIVSSSLKVFTFTLSSVSRTATPTGSDSSPRLSTSNLIGQVTIVDDEGGAGVFSLSPNVASVSEGGVLSFTVRREGGSAGAVSVLVMTVEGEASEGADYTALSQQLEFSDGTTERLLTVPILDDSIPEGDEGFRVQLVEGGGSLVDPVNGVLDVIIPSNDNPGGVFTISTLSPLTLVDLTAPTATVTVTRSGGLVVPVVINWEAVYNDSEVHEPIASFVNMPSGRINFLSGQTRPDVVIQLALRPNLVPAGGETFILRISSPTPGVVLETTEITVMAQPRPVSVFEIVPSTKTQVITAPGPVSITINRTDGFQLTSTVVYNTHTLNQIATVGGLTFEVAQPGVHFARIENALVTFAPGDQLQTVTLSVIAVPSTPLAFFMDISIQGTGVVSDEAVIVVMPANPLSNIISLYFQSLIVSNFAELEDVSTSLASTVTTLNGADNDHTDTLRLTVDQLILTSTTPTTTNTNIDNNYVSNMLNVFNSILTDPSFIGQSLIVQSMKSFAYSLVEDDTCPASNTEVLKTHSRTAFVLEALKIRPLLLASRQFMSSDSADYIQFPAQSLTTSQTCVTVHFIEFLNDQIFGQPTFKSKVMSVGVANRDIQPVSGDPILLRLHTSQTVGIVPDTDADNSDDCIHWSYPSSAMPTGEWSSDFCYPITEYSNVLLEDSIMCACRQFGDLAAATDIRLGYAWTWPAGLSAGFVLVVMVLIMMVHLCYLSRTQLATRILICLCLSVFLFQLMLLIDVFASRSPTLSSDGCVALGALLHFTIVLQFVWIVALALALWVNFMGFTDGREPLIAYVVSSWGLSVVVVVLTILIGRFAVPLSNEQLYSRTNGDLCFIPSLPVSLLSVVLPVVLAILVVIAFLSHSCVYWSRWEDYHNIYHDSFNRTEIPLLLIFFAFIFFTGLAGYLHVYVTVVYTYGAFVALNVIQGVYALIVYFFVSWHTLTRKHKKFVLGDEVEPLSVPEEPDYLASMNNLSTSRHKMDPQDEWAEDSDVTPVVGVGMNRYNDDMGSQASVSESQGDSHLDDLMFMLKTQTYQSDKEGSKVTSNRPKGAEHLELRRISIADTHL